MKLYGQNLTSSNLVHYERLLFNFSLENVRLYCYDPLSAALIDIFHGRRLKNFTNSSC